MPVAVALRDARTSYERYIYRNGERRKPPHIILDLLF